MSATRTSVTSSQLYLALRAWVAVATVLLLLMLMVGSAPAHAAFGVAGFDGQVTANSAGDPFTQAGGHPYAISTQIQLNTGTHPTNPTVPNWPAEPVKDLIVELPPGLVGNPTAVEQCTLDQLSVKLVGGVLGPLCPAGSQVGVAAIDISPGVTFQPIAVYSMAPPEDVPARFGMNVLGAIVTLDASVRSGSDYGLTVNARNISQGVPLIGTALTFWGNPSDPSHDAERYCPGADVPGCDAAPQHQFLRNPTACTPDGVGLETVLRADSWANPGVFDVTSFFSHLPPGLPDGQPPESWGPQQGPTGCDLVPFDASLTAEPSGRSAKAGAPSGYTFELTMSQEDDPDTGIAPSDLRKAVVTLPAGVRVSPSAAQGLQGCSSAEIALDSEADATCPDASKVGSLTIDTPLLDEQLRGSVYLATPFDNPSDSLLAIYLVAKGPGLIVKLPGGVEANPLTGQLTATFDNNPQVPFTRLNLRFNGGPRAQLVNPSECGTYTTHAELTSWSGKTVVSDSSFEVSHDGNGAPCPPRPFSPTFEAGTLNPVAGTSSSFFMSLERDDASQEFATLEIDLPRGLLARVADVPRCPDAQATAGTCGGGSLIGTVTTGAGPGANPFYIDNGRVYLTEGYDGAPFGLSIVVPAVAGPFDLGLVVVRAAIHVDRRTAELRVVSDPVPQVLQGIRLQVRDIRVSIDRDGFMVNPTNCAEQRVGGKVGSISGQVAELSTRFQVGDCSALPLEPTMQLRVGARGKTRVGRSTPLVATLRQSASQANLKSVAVTLPMTINALLTVVDRACTMAEFEAGDCDQAKAGRAVAETPLLKDSLRGSAYFVKSDRALPDLIVALKGEVDFDLVGRISIPGGKRLRTTFATVPDVPVSRFTLRLQSGANGIVGVARNLCTKQSKRAPAHLVLRGQNGATVRKSQRLKITGCPTKAARNRR